MKRNRAAVLGRLAAIAGASSGIWLGAGCGTPPPEAGMPPGALQSVEKYKTRSDVKPKADAGVDVPHSTDIDPAKFVALISSHSFSSRPDAFALLASEKVFDQEQRSEYFLQLMPFSTEYSPPEEPAPAVIEPQPYRRLAGVMVGDSISAIIDMGDGKTQIIYPGEKIPGTEWTVVSIDEDKAVLRRPGNVKPNEVVVPLAASLAGIVVPNQSGTGTTGGGPGNVPNAPGGRGGAPMSGPPGGRRGGPGQGGGLGPGD